MGLWTLAKSNESCLWKNHFEANCRLFLRQNGSCGDCSNWKFYKITFSWVTTLQTNWLGKEQPSKSFKKMIRLYLVVFIKQGTLRQAEQRWKNATNCEISKHTWPCHNLKRTKTLLGLHKSDVKTLTEIWTEHWLIGIHEERMGRNSYNFSRSCQQLERKKILNIYSVSVHHIIERGTNCWVTTSLATYAI